MENRYGLAVDFQVTATGMAERDVVSRLITDARVRGFKPRTLGVERYTQNLWIGAGVRSAAYPPGCQGPETAERPSRERYAAC
jgi:hypothetical protein